MKGAMTDVYMYLGKEKLASGDCQGAIADFTDAIRLDPDFAPAYSNRGLAKSELGDNEGAITDYNQAIHLTYYYRGNAKSELGDEQGVIADYDQMSRLLQQQGVLEMYEELDP